MKLKDVAGSWDVEIFKKLIRKAVAEIKVSEDDDYHRFGIIIFNNCATDVGSLMLTLGFGFEKTI